MLDPAADATGDRFRKQRRGAVVLRRAGRRTQCVSLPRTAESEQGDDIRIGQRRIGTVVQREMTGRTGEVDGHLILVDGRSGLDVEHRVEAKWIRKIDVAAREFEVISAE